MALAVFAIVIIVGLVVSNVIISRERDLARTQRRIAQDESRHADHERKRALDRSRQARQAVDEMYTEVAEKWLYEQPQLSQVQRDFLEKASAFYEQFSQEEGTDPAVQLERAKAISRLSWLRLRLGHPEDAEKSLFKPVEILGALVEQYPERPEYLEALGQASGTLASRFSEQKRWNEANLARERALDAYQKLVNRVPAEAGYRLTLATHQAQLGLQYQFSGRVLEAQRLGFDGLASLDRLQHDYPKRSDPHDLRPGCAFSKTWDASWSRTGGSTRPKRPFASRSRSRSVCPTASSRIPIYSTESRIRICTWGTRWGESAGGVTPRRFIFGPVLSLNN